MIMWTIVSDDVLWPADTSRSKQVEVAMGNRILVLDVDDQGAARVCRLLSSDPQDYLDSRWQPGTPFSLQR